MNLAYVIRVVATTELKALQTKSYSSVEGNLESQYQCIVQIVQHDPLMTRCIAFQWADSQL